ncbi:uncharacterized protein LOC130967121 [Arachis stenosperma]|uniref:uncharacterized protein LOC130967121 n=1 Tax=Arachis stenosperma TaxID=217475 RepID=UPI0025AD8AB9|nr:uncharacterized protein LOC130967121 [Arachis stenosperma]
MALGLRAQGSISSFEELAQSFIDDFAASSIYVHGSDYLSTIKQGQHESLKDYMMRFAKATMKIPDLSPEVHLHPLKSGLLHGKFQETMVVTKPKTLVEFREKAAGQMETEELWEARRADKQQPRRDEEKHHKTQNHKDHKKPFKLTPKAGSYQDQKYVDKSKHCAFHQKFGHTTDECVIAKDLLERLARQGHLEKSVSGRIQQEKQSSTDVQPEQNPRDT